MGTLGKQISLVWSLDKSQIKCRTNKWMISSDHRVYLRCFANWPRPGVFSPFGCIGQPLQRADWLAQARTATTPFHAMLLPSFSVAKGYSHCFTHIKRDNGDRLSLTKLDKSRNLRCLCGLCVGFAALVPLWQLGLGASEVPLFGSSPAQG